MGKMLKFVADIMEAMTEASANFNKAVNNDSATADRATYGDVVQAVTKHVKDGFWKKRILSCVPKDATPSEYAAAKAIIEDDSMDGFWRKQAVSEVFKRP